jgi:hypothetical protein
MTAIDAGRPPDSATPDAAHPDVATPLALALSLLRNGGFDTATDLRGWKPELLATAVWDGRDAAGNPASGSLAVTNGNTAEAVGSSEAGARRCLIVPGGEYRIGADVLIAEGRSDGLAGLSFSFFPSTNCAGAASGPPTESLIGGAGAWMRVQVAAAPPPGANSMLVRGVALKPFRQPALTVLFDNVIVQAQ